jgi:hypothetical protein
VLAFSLLVAMVTTLLFGLVPALQTARRDMVEPLKDAGKVSGGFRRGRLRSVLVVVSGPVAGVAGGPACSCFVALRRSIPADPENILVARFHRHEPHTRPPRKQRFFRTPRSDPRASRRGGGTETRRCHPTVNRH